MILELTWSDSDEDILFETMTYFTKSFNIDLNKNKYKKSLIPTTTNDIGNNYNKSDSSSGELLNYIENDTQKSVKKKR